MIFSAKHALYKQKNGGNMKKENNQFDQVFEEDLVAEVLEDFKNRQQERKNFGAQWELNMNFLMGNQYCCIGPTGEVEEFDKQYYWQEREVYNHIAPIVEARLAKLLSLKPTMAVVPSSGDEKDIKPQNYRKKLLMQFITNFVLAESFPKQTVGAKFAEQVFIKLHGIQAKEQF